MGLFDKKIHFTIDEMAMETALSALKMIRDMERFPAVDEKQAMAVICGYFYGFLKIQLNSITNLKKANLIIDKSINHLEDAITSKYNVDVSGEKIKAVYNKSLENIHYAYKELKSNPFLGMGALYLVDLYNTSPSIDASECPQAEINMRMLYKEASRVVQNIKI